MPQNFYPHSGLSRGNPSNQQQPQPQPLVQLDTGTSDAPVLRRSDRIRQQPAPRPGDVYGNSNPTRHQQVDLRTRLPNEEIPEETSAGSPIASVPALTWPPLPPSPNGSDDPWGTAGSMSYQDLEFILPCLCSEGGAPFINYLLVQAVQPDNERDKSLPPAISKIRDWKFCQDILWLPKAQKEEWKKACHE